MERQLSGQCYRALLGISAQYLAGSWHLNWADCRQVTLLVNLEPGFIKCSRAELSQEWHNLCASRVRYKEHSHLSLSGLFRHQQVKVCRCTSKHQLNARKSCFLFGGIIMWRSSGGHGFVRRSSTHFRFKKMLYQSLTTFCIHLIFSDFLMFVTSMCN